MNAWVEHHKRLSNGELDWSNEYLSFVSPILGPASFVTLSQVSDAIKKMKNRKTEGLSSIVAEMLKASGFVGLKVLAYLIKSVIVGGGVPADWRDSIIVNLYKGKENAIDRENYINLELTDHFIKLVERVLER